MSVASADLKLKLPTVLATDFTTADIGGAKTSTVITGATVGEVLFAMAANTSGGNRLQYGKLFQDNESADDLSSAVQFLANGMDDLDTDGYVLTIQSSSTADGSNLTARCIGNDSGGDAQDEFGLAGTSVASGSIVFEYGAVIEFRDTVTGALTPLTGYATVRHNGVIVAIAPPGSYSVTAEIKFGLAATLNDSATTADAATAPSGISFAKPRTAAAGTALANSGVLTGGDAQGIWLLWTCAENRRPSADVEIYLLCEGDSA